MVPMIGAFPGTAIAEPEPPSRAQLDGAKAKLGELNENLSAMVEEYNAVKAELEETQKNLETAQADVDRYGGEADEARAKLADRTADAYVTGGGSAQLEVLFDSGGTFTDFSDRIEFLSALAEENEAIALDAQNATAKAAMAADALQAAKEVQQEQEAELAKQQETIRQNIQEQAALVKEYEIQYQDALDAYQAELQAQREAEAAAAAEAAENGGGDGSGDGGTGGGEPDYNPPPSSSAASYAVKVAMDQIGDEYQWGAAGPDEFDCSGLVVYSYGKAGISLPHYSGSLYSSLPKVNRSDLQVGDLVFFYNPIHHVGIYIGGGNMVHAFSEGSPVSVDSVFGGYYGSVYVGASRPG